MENVETILETIGTNITFLAHNSTIHQIKAEEIRNNSIQLLYKIKNYFEKREKVYQERFERAKNKRRRFYNGRTRFLY